MHSGCRRGGEGGQRDRDAYPSFVPRKRDRPGRAGRDRQRRRELNFLRETLGLELPTFRALNRKQNYINQSERSGQGVLDAVALPNPRH